MAVAASAGSFYVVIRRLLNVVRGPLSSECSRSLFLQQWLNEEDQRDDLVSEIAAEGRNLEEKTPSTFKPYAIYIVTIIVQRFVRLRTRPGS